jgi:hypothetical protein
MHEFGAINHQHMNYFGAFLPSIRENALLLIMLMEIRGNEVSIGT